MHKLTTLSLAIALTTVATAQVQSVRGAVENVPGTANQFFLDCTNLPVTSTAINLNQILGQQMILQVINTGSASAPVLDVQTATVTTKVFELGDLRIGRVSRWQVTALTGSFTFMFFDFTADTAYRPLGNFGTLLLGGMAVTMTSGTTNALSLFEFSFVVPPAAAPLVGMSFTGQALVGDHGTWFFSNPACKTVQAQ